MNYSAPTYFISLSNLTDYTDIKKFCKKNDIQIMLYTINWKSHVLKHGIQYMWSPKTYGDRLYTQIGWMPGWNKPCLQRQPSTGEFVKLMIEKVELTYNTTFHKNDVSLVIEDYTNYPFNNPTNIYAEMQNFEEAAKESYFNTHGHYPIGNLKQEGIRPILQLNNPMWEID